MGPRPNCARSLEPAKEELCLLLLYYVPLATLRNERGFKMVMLIALIRPRRHRA